MKASSSFIKIGHLLVQIRHFANLTFKKLQFHGQIAIAWESVCQRHSILNKNETITWIGIFFKLFRLVELSLLGILAHRETFYLLSLSCVLN